MAATTSLGARSRKDGNDQGAIPVRGSPPACRRPPMLHTPDRTTTPELVRPSLTCSITRASPPSELDARSTKPTTSPSRCRAGTTCFTRAGSVLTTTTDGIRPMDVPGNACFNNSLACVSANENDGDEFTSITAHLTSRQDLVISAVKKSIPDRI